MTLIKTETPIATIVQQLKNLCTIFRTGYYSINTGTYELLYLFAKLLGLKILKLNWNDIT